MAFDDPNFGNLHDIGDGIMLLDGAYPNKLLEHFHKFGPVNLKLFSNIKGKTVVDVNANIGIMTLLLSKAVGPEGTVISIEPSAWNFSVLMENIRRCPWANNIVSKRCAIGNKHMKQLQPLYHNVYDGNGHALHPIREGNDDDFEQVSVTTLDHIVDDRDDLYLINFNIPDGEDAYCTNAGCISVIVEHDVKNFIRNGKTYIEKPVLKV